MRSHVIVSIGLAAVLALTICPLLADESDGDSWRYYFYADGERIGQCISDDVHVPEPPEIEGKEFIGWTADGVFVDPYTYVPSGTTTYYAQYIDSTDPDKPGTEADIFVIACIIGAIVCMAAMLWKATR